MRKNMLLIRTPKLASFREKSNTWQNHFSQADACHAYQIVHRNGIPDEQIIVMMYDDIANSEEWVGSALNLMVRNFRAF